MIKKWLFVLFAVILAFFINNWQPEHPLGFYNSSASAPEGFYRIDNTLSLERGQYIILPVPEKAISIVQGRSWMQPGIPLLKKIGAMPGDIVTITEDGLFINQSYIGPVFLEDRQGLPLPQIRETFQIQEGEFLPISLYEKSFDGRYFGPVSIASIQYKVVPLLTY